jgi:hypothetical protein
MYISCILFMCAKSWRIISIVETCTQQGKWTRSSVPSSLSLRDYDHVNPSHRHIQLHCIDDFHGIDPSSINLHGIESKRLLSWSPHVSLPSSSIDIVSFQIPYNSRKWSADGVATYRIKSNWTDSTVKNLTLLDTTESVWTPTRPPSSLLLYIIGRHRVSPATSHVRSYAT